MAPNQMAMDLVKKTHILEYGLAYCTSGEFAGKVVLYCEEHEETGHAICNIEVPKGHPPVEVIIPHNFLLPMTPEQFKKMEAERGNQMAT